MKPQRLKAIAAVISIGILILALAIAFYLFTRPKVIPFTVIEEGYSLVAPQGLPRQEPEPLLIVIASQEDMQLPSRLTWPEPLAVEMGHIDFKQSLVILARRGRQEDSGTVQEVVRRQDTVVIRTRDLIVGPGNYVSDGWTQPYELIVINKDTNWGKNIRFVLQRETQGIAGETIRFVP